MSEIVTFIDDRYYTSPLGQYWPRVTTILEAYPKGEGFYSWLKATGRSADDILNTAGEVGTRVHRATQEYDSGTTLSWATKQWNKDEWALLCKYADFCSFCNPEVLLSEVSLVSDQLQYGGTIDRVMMVEGKRLLIDIKTSNYIYNQHWCQVAAYAELYRRAYLADDRIEIMDRIALNHLDGVGILHLKAKTRKEMKTKTGWQGKGWDLEIKDMDEVAKDYEVFQHTYKLWRHENEDYQPGVKTYPAVLVKPRKDLEFYASPLHALTGPDSIKQAVTLQPNEF